MTPEQLANIEALVAQVEATINTTRADYIAARSALLAAIHAIAAPPAPAPVQAAPDDFITVAVKNLDPLLDALDRAERKGYLPDAMAAEWEAFELGPVTAAAPSPDPQPKPDALPPLTEAMYWAARGAMGDAHAWSDDDLDHLWDAINTANRVQGQADKGGV